MRGQLGLSIGNMKEGLRAICPKNADKHKTTTYLRLYIRYLNQHWEEKSLKTVTASFGGIPGAICVRPLVPILPHAWCVQVEHANE